MHLSPSSRIRIALALSVAAISAFVCAPLRVHAVDAAGIFDRGGPRLIVTRRVHTGPQPKSVTVSPDGRQLWVAVFGRRNHDNVEVYDATSLSLWGRVSFEGNAVESVFTHDGRTAYVSNFSRGTVEEIDVGTRTVRASIPGGLNPKVLVLSADDRLLYVVNWRSNDVYVVDTHTRARLQTLPTGRHPRGLVVLANGTVLVASTEADVIHEFARDGTERRRIAACDFPRSLSLSLDERTLYVTCSGLSLVVAYDLARRHAHFRRTYGREPAIARGLARRPFPRDRGLRWHECHTRRSRGPCVPTRPDRRRLTDRRCGGFARKWPADLRDGLALTGAVDARARAVAPHP